MSRLNRDNFQGNSGFAAPLNGNAGDWTLLLQSTGEAQGVLLGLASDASKENIRSLSRALHNIPDQVIATRHEDDALHATVDRRGSVTLTSVTISKYMGYEFIYDPEKVEAYRSSASDQFSHALWGTGAADPDGWDIEAPPDPASVNNIRAQIPHEALLAMIWAELDRVVDCGGRDETIPPEQALKMPSPKISPHALNRALEFAAHLQIFKHDDSEFILKPSDSARVVSLEILGQETSQGFRIMNCQLTHSKPNSGVAGVVFDLISGKWGAAIDDEWEGKLMEPDQHQFAEDAVNQMVNWFKGVSGADENTRAA